MVVRVYDLAIIGGGLSGAAIARDAAGRGLNVFLCDEADLGGGASSASTKLIHGAIGLLDGLRLGAMREAVVEREIAMRAAPHLLRPLRFVIPHHERQWSRAAFGVGLFAFDHIARSSLPPSRRLALDTEGTHSSLLPDFEVGFAYSDCVADDSRLVILNALDAREHGAGIFPRHRCNVAEREGGRWRLSLESAVTGEQAVVHATVLINAGGAAVADVHNHVVHSSRPLHARFRKSACIVVKRETLDAVGYALPNADGRIVFAFPWHSGTMLIGAVERKVDSSELASGVDRRDTAYLCDVARQYFDTSVWPDDIVWSFAGVSAEPEERSDFVVVDAPPRSAPLISVLGGTLTGHRKLAEQVVGMLAVGQRIPPPWTARAVLPGGGFPPRGGGDLGRALRAAYPFLSDGHATRLVRAYGTRASMVLTGARSAADLGIDFGGDLTEAEVRYLRTEEWAATADDVLWRRSKLGLVLTLPETMTLADWMEAQPLMLPQPL